MRKLMPTLLIPEIFESSAAQEKKTDKQKVLREGRTPAMMTCLYMCYHPSVQFDIKKIPHYTPEITPTGMAMNSLYASAKTLYIWRNDYKLDPKRKTELLLQLLESVDAKEADLLEQIFQKKLKYEGLTYEFIAETFPELNLPQRVTA